MQDDMVSKLNEQILQARKLDSIGTLAGGVAHDFNNILTVIIGACTLLEQEVAGNSEHMALVSRISSFAARAAKLTQSLLTFSRRQKLSKQSEDLGQVVSTMQDFLARIVGDDIMLTTYLPDEPLMAMVDRGQLEQVLTILAANARDAMPHGGILNIEVSRVEINSCPSGLDELLAGDYALISVSDSGIGIEKTTQQRIFEPFFTTRANGKGTGLGLSMAYGIVRRHDGVIEVCSEPGVGTTFKIYVPIRGQLDKEASEQFTRLPGGSEIILLVEDNPEVLAINRELLERAGYMVLSALDGVEALELFKRGFDAIALVVLDVIMPGLNGKDIYEKLKVYKNNIKVLFVSGDPAEILNGKGVVQDNVCFMSKPLNPPVFLGCVRTLIDGC